MPERTEYSLNELRIITIAGSHRGVGKTHLARMLRDVFGPRSQIVKIGRGRDKGKPERLLRNVADLPPLVDGLRTRGACSILIVESGRAGEVVKTDLSFFIEGWERSGKVNDNADIVVGRDFDAGAVRNLLFRKGFSNDVNRVLAEFIRSRERRNGMDAKGTEIKMRVDGKEVPLNPFARSIISAVILGMVGQLKGIDEAKDIEIHVRQE